MRRVGPSGRAAAVAVLCALSMVGCGSSGSTSGTDSDIDRDETVGVEVTSSPSARAVHVSITGSGGSTSEVDGITPLSTEVRVHVECNRGNKLCILGNATFAPSVNDPSTGTLTLCLSAFGTKQCATSTILVVVSVPF
jgi:hypothetical protein